MKTRIKNGNLFLYQQDNLERYRFGKQYLAEKYPNYDLQIVSGEPKSKLTAYAEFLFTENTETEKLYKLYVYNREDSETYYAEDDFYASFFTGQYDTYLQGVLEKEIGHVVTVSFSMPWPKGKEYGFEMTVEDVINGNLELSVNSEIYIVDNAMKEDAAVHTAVSVKKFIQNNNLYGSFHVYVYGADYSIEELSVAEIILNDCLFNEAFQNFRE